MIAVGKYSTLRIEKRTSSGLLLGDGEETVLLPNKFVPQGAKEGDSLTVFVYTDSEDDLIATTQTPKAVVGDFACLEVLDESPHGAYLDWGLDKDLFAHKSEQHAPMRVGQSYVVAVYRDEETGRVAASSRLGQFLERDTSELSLDEEVEILVFGFNERGAQVLVNERFGGLVFSTDTFRELSIGEKLKGYVKGLRPDGKVDVALQRSGLLRVHDARDVVLEALAKNGGKLALGDKSPPEKIYAELGLSKKAFKAAIGSLYKSRRIVITDGGIEIAPAGK